ncbi:hypothetical protein IQ259_09175 [Fortiea sp. LEGE XX443]|uniref:hypothetical protein n=1 Tax=Fortiea sp. LEGE XX443 TaxID=1828611 RepID=UPI00187F7A1C|nr:hypothetical protein [Fortiea sp. LEGE XX443]MBE9005210.1 hypothetical protein [Fortiea sp. LEGE XX443]
MAYFDSEEKTELELEVYKNQRISIAFIFMYLVGIIISTSALINTNKGILNLLYLTIAPISSIGWRYFTNKIYDYKASIYNRFGENNLHWWLNVFWGNKQLPVIALLISLIIIISSFFNFFVLGTPANKGFKESLVNICQMKQVNEDTVKKVKELQQLTDSLGKNNPIIIEQDEFKKINEKLNNIQNQLCTTPPNSK